MRREVLRRRTLLLVPAAVAAICWLLSGGLGSARRSSGFPLSPVAAQEGAKLPTTGQTSKDFERFLLEWNRKTMADAYREVGIRDPAWDEPVLKLLDLMTQRFAMVPPGPTAEELTKAADKVAETQSTDPLALYCVGAVRQGNGDLAGAEQMLRAAVTGYEGSRYPKCRMWSAPLRLAFVCEDLRGGKEAEVARWQDLVVKWLSEAAAEPVVTQGGQRALWTQYDGAFTGSLLGKREQLIDALTRQPGADPWFTHMVAGCYHASAAWEARGGKWAYLVTDKGWEGFRRHLGEATKDLEQAWKLHPEYPEAATVMIQVAMGSEADVGTPREWFDRAVAAQLDYRLAYDKLLWALRPRWGGSHEEMYQFGLECLATKRFDTIVPGRLYQAIWDIAEDEGEQDWWRKPDVYANLCALFEGNLSSDQDPESAACHRSLYAAVAWRAGHYDKARELLDQLGDKAHGEVFADEFRVPFEKVRGEVHALTGPLAEKAAEAERLYEEGSVGKALPAYEALLPRADDPLAAAYLRDRIAAMRIEKAYNEGKWVDLLPDKGFAGWWPQSDKWVVEDDGCLALLPGANWVKVICDAPLEGDCEVQGEVEFPPTIDSAGLGVCLQFRNAPKPFWTYAGLGGPNREATFVRETKPITLQARNTFVVKLWRSQGRFILNDHVIYEGQALEEPSPFSWPTPQFALYGANFSPEGAPARFRSLRIHRLAARPDDMPEAKEDSGTRK